jgi:uncharacterized protein YdeI (YjbR/CyaY-like superfamily)
MQEIFCKNKHELWKWLQKNHTQSESVWLVYHKPSLKLGDLDAKIVVDYCLCFGWIDSVVGKVDDTKTKIRISPRNPKSKWSRVNKENVERLMKHKAMQPAGLEMVKIAKKTGTWDALNDVENLVLPKDLKEALVTQSMNTAWEGLSRSYKRGYLETLLNAKKEETRKRTIAKILHALSTKD